MREPQAEVPVTPLPVASALAIAVCILATLYLGVFPGRVLDYAAQSARQLVGETAPIASSAPSALEH